jgi:S-formylglutathione hydrolase FrmB
MGGHGGLWLGFRHPDLFGACGSSSGGVDIRPFPENWEIKKWLGRYQENRERWDAYTVVNQLHLLRPDSQAIIIDCGTEDFFYEVNEVLHEKLLEHRIPHDYLTRPGGHNAAYWKNAIEYQLLFFRLFFDRMSSTHSRGMVL